MEGLQLPLWFEPDWQGGVIVGGLWEVLVIFGVHWGITPVTVGNQQTWDMIHLSGFRLSCILPGRSRTGRIPKDKRQRHERVSLSL